MCLSDGSDEHADPADLPKADREVKVPPMGKHKALERKSLTLKMDAPPDDQGHFTGYAAVFGNVDKGNDVIEAGAVTKTLKENPDVPIFWIHGYDVVPVGTGTLTCDSSCSLNRPSSLARSTAQ
jgi:hypothetical protein